MRRASLIFTLLFSSADALAQDPLDTVLRDAQRLAGCMKALDSPCVIALSDIPSYQRLSTPAVTAAGWARTQNHYFDVLRDHNWGWSAFDVTAPREVFQDGARLYTFVPYVSRSNFGGQAHTQQAFEVALSVDRGQTWMFVDGIHLTPARMRVIIPSYAGQPLPPTSEAPIDRQGPAPR